VTKRGARPKPSHGGFFICLGENDTESSKNDKGRHCPPVVHKQEGFITSWCEVFETEHMTDIAIREGNSTPSLTFANPYKVRS